MVVTINDIGGQVVKDNETYLLKDNTTLKNLVLSSTRLNPMQSTRGHAHPGQEEVYTFVSGSGLMELKYPDGTSHEFAVFDGMIVLIEDGVFHRVINTSENMPLYFICVFDGKRNH